MDKGNNFKGEWRKEKGESCDLVSAKTSLLGFAEREQLHERSE